ncbi:ester cyclase (plasmid) [Pseudomonas luteola]|uniref:ester cyclase n=1 Tax=Pseudomonas luteola TaxID=47886 RepID=UPI003DA1C14C
MSNEANKALVSRFYDALQNGQYDLIRELCHQDFVFYAQVDMPHYGAEGFIASEKKNLDAFKGFRMPIKALVAEGDQVAAYLEFEGIQSGEIAGVAPAGKRLRMSLMMLLRIADGKIIEKRAHFDNADIKRQLLSC